MTVRRTRCRLDILPAERIGGVRVSTTAELYRIVDSLDPGAKAQIALQRGERDVELVLAIPATRQVTTRRPAVIEVPADMPEYARILLRQQQDNADLIDALHRDVRALRAEVHALRR